jgi:hypothetical protein
MQGNTLAPPTMPFSGQESQVDTMSKSKGRIRYLGFIIFAILKVTVFMALLYFFVLRIRTPRVKLTSVKATNGPRGNVVLTAFIYIKNGNAARYKFNNSTGTIVSRDRVVGSLQIPKGRVKSRRWIKATANLDNHIRNGDMPLPLMINATLSGELVFLGGGRKRRDAKLNCAMNINLSGPSLVVDNLSCT